MSLEPLSKLLRQALAAPKNRSKPEERSSELRAAAGCFHAEVVALPVGFWTIRRMVRRSVLKEARCCSPPAAVLVALCIELKLRLRGSK